MLLYIIIICYNILFVNSALVCTQREVEKIEIQTVGERKRREEDLPPRSLPSNSLVIFINFYWLHFNTIYFILLFILFCLCELFYYFRSFYFILSW